MIENVKGAVRCITAQASWCTLQAHLPAHPQAPAPHHLDGRAKATKEFFQDARAKMLGNQHPSSVQVGRRGEYAEILQLSCLLEEIVARVPVGPTCVFFGP